MDSAPAATSAGLRTHHPQKDTPLPEAGCTFFEKTFSKNQGQTEKRLSVIRINGRLMRRTKLYASELIKTRQFQ